MPHILKVESRLIPNEVYEVGLKWLTLEGHILQSDNSLKLDIGQKRGIFISEMNSLLQEFANLSPQLVLKLLNTSAMSFYGSNLWDLFRKGSEKIYASLFQYQTSLELADVQTGFLFSHSLTPFIWRQVLASKFVAIHKSLTSSAKFTVRFLAR